MIRVQIEGRPAPKGSRIAGKTKEGKPYTYPASKYESKWVAAVAEATHQIMRHRQTPVPPYSVDLTFLIAVTRPRNRKRAGPWPTQHDIDKLARAVVDGLVKGNAMEDDRHVTELRVRKRWTREGEQSGVIADVDSIAEQYRLDDVA